MRIAKIAVEAATYAIDKPYSYLVPAEMALGVGCRVLAPFGRGNRTSEGIILARGSGEKLPGLKPESGRRSSDLPAGDQAGAVDAAAVFLHVLRRHSHDPARRRVVPLP